MSWFYKKTYNSNGKTIYSIKEKIAYYTNLKNNGTTKQKKLAEYNLKRLNNYKKLSNTFGKVFITRDNYFCKSNSYKSRRVVVVDYDKKKNKYGVLPINKNNLGYLKLENFDNDRYIQAKQKCKWIPSYDMYENRSVRNTNNDKLTNKEISFLKKVRLSLKKIKNPTNK